MAFIEKLDGPALSLSPEEFEGYMLGQRTPCALNRRQQVISDTQNLLEDLKGRQEKLDQGMDALNAQLQKWVQEVHSQLDETRSQFVLAQKEITAQKEVLLSTQDNKESSVLVLEDQDGGLRETGC